MRAFSLAVSPPYTHPQAILYGFASLLPFFLPWQNDGRADANFLRREFGDMEVPVQRLCNR